MKPHVRYYPASDLWVCYGPFNAEKSAGGSFHGASCRQAYERWLTVKRQYDQVMP